MLQDDVEIILRTMNINYKKEETIFGVFKVDFIIDKTILEVNGPSHYVFYN